MSYSFNMVFVDRPIETEAYAWSWFYSFVRKLMSSKDITNAMLDENKYFIANSLYRAGIKESNAVERRHDASIIFEYCVDRIFTFKAIYWPEHKILGFVFGDMPDELMEGTTSVYFQNSCDQDYEFSVWSDNIPLFHQMKQEALAMSAEDLMTDDWKDSDLEYVRRSYLYKRIYDALKLDCWLYGGDDPDVFSRLALCGLTHEEMRMDFRIRARAMFKDWFTPTNNKEESQ